MTFHCDFHGVLKIEAKNEKEAKKLAERELSILFSDNDSWADIIEITEVKK